MGTAPLVDQMNVGDPAAGTDAVEFARVVARGAHHGQLYAGEPYFAAYVPRVVANRDAAAVKRADAELNLAQCEAEGNSLASRYRRVIAAIDAAHPDLARPPLGR